MTWLLIAGGVLLFGGGAATGVAISRTRADKVLEHQTALIAELQEGQRNLLDAQREAIAVAGKPVVLDAEVRAALSNTPPACIRDLGGDALSPVCSLHQCWAMGQSSANRPECGPLLDLVVSLQKGTSASE